jgi:hypothetical protein
MTSERRYGDVKDVKSYFGIGRESAYDLCRAHPWAEKFAGKWIVNLARMREWGDFGRQGVWRNESTSEEAPTTVTSGLSAGSKSRLASRARLRPVPNTGGGSWRSVSAD